MKNRILGIIPWLITAVALYYAFWGIETAELKSNFASVRFGWVAAAIGLTAASYIVRAYRWELFFPATELSYFDSLRVLILGFFMNNVLPARTGELVRAHIGSKVTGEKRTLVLATIASERLVDGLVISLLFAALAGGLGDPNLSANLSYVALGFGAAAAGVLVLLAVRERVFALVKRLNSKIDSKAGSYATERIQIFIEGLSPLSSWNRIPGIALWSLGVWLIELAVYVCITNAYGIQGFKLAHWVLFMATVNFSSLIPSAPGAFGVIEAVTPKVLLSLGLGLTREVALAMVLTQHLVQYFVVGLPGVFIWLGWRKLILQLDNAVA